MDLFNFHMDSGMGILVGNPIRAYGDKFSSVLRVECDQLTAFHPSVTQNTFYHKIN